MSDHYAAAGVDIAEADAGVRALVDVLRTIEPGRPSLSVLPSGHYANVLRVAPNLGIAVGADGVVLLGDPFVFDADNIGDFDF